jgi:Fe-S-cluster containining protein
MVVVAMNAEAASRICMNECRAQCCRGPLVLHLGADEVAGFRERGAALGEELRLRESTDGGATVVFLEHAGERCPMLDDATSACRIYESRPERCRAFPDRPRADCAISGAE